MAKSTAAALAQSLRNRGFDKSHVSGDHARVGCSQCAALAINGIPCHETGCPNNRRRNHDHNYDEEE